MLSGHSGSLASFCFSIFLSFFVIFIFIFILLLNYDIEAFPLPSRRHLDTLDLYIVISDIGRRGRDGYPAPVSVLTRGTLKRELQDTLERKEKHSNNTGITPKGNN